MIKKYRNSGMFLESIINKAIDYYQKNNLALFNKVSLPIKIQNLKNDKIKNGWIIKKSTVDYCGLYKGKFIAFEVKSTIKAKFWISQIKNHQVKFLEKVLFHQGIAFYIIGFESAIRYFVVDFETIINLKSKFLVIKDVEKYGYEITWILPNILNFLPIINLLINKKNKNALWGI